MNRTRPEALNYLDGYAVHWYWDNLISVDVMEETLERFNPKKNKLLINSEACIGDKPWQKHGPVLGSWSRAEAYIKSLMEDLTHNYNAWIDWNLVLDGDGGPNYVQNTVDASIIAPVKGNSTIKIVNL